MKEWLNSTAEDEGPAKGRQDVCKREGILVLAEILSKLQGIVTPDYAKKMVSCGLDFDVGRIIGVLVRLHLTWHERRQLSDDAYAQFKSWHQELVALMTAARSDSQVPAPSPLTSPRTPKVLVLLAETLSKLQEAVTPDDVKALVIEGLDYEAAQVMTEIAQVAVVWHRRRQLSDDAYAQFKSWHQELLDAFELAKSQRKRRH